MDADATTMALENFPLFLKKHCATCDMLGYWAPRMWKCDVCQDYFLCENCYKGSLADGEVPSALPQVHNRDYLKSMLPHWIEYSCNGCESSPIWKHRWCCKVCSEFDLCETCYGGLDAADLPPGHSKEHPMLAVDVVNPENLLKFQSCFNKRVETAQWLNPRFAVKNILTEISSASHMGIVEDGTTQTSPKTHDNNNGHISRLQKNISLKYKSLSPKHGLETSSTQRVFDTRHKIFLSHAGAQIFFVKELHQELLKVHHFGTFFDKDDGSLPKGETFPHKILNEAQHCELAIVVISKDYFTQKWPMLQLATFVKEQKRRPELKILPVFYKLSVEEFKQSKQSYVRSWKQMSSVSEDDIQLWKEALKVISCTNGIEFDKNMGKMALKKQIVETVCKRVKHEILWDDSDVQGKACMHEMIEVKFSNLNNAGGGVQSTFSTYMGLYGMGGSGKTTMSKVFCNKMMQWWRGTINIFNLHGVVWSGRFWKDNYV